MRCMRAARCREMSNGILGARTVHLGCRFWLRRQNDTGRLSSNAHEIHDPGSKNRAALRVISEHLIAGRWDDVRSPTPKELKATSVLEFSIEEASAKIRTGPPLDDEEDYSSVSLGRLSCLESWRRNRLYAILDLQMVSKCHSTFRDRGHHESESTPLA